LSNGRGAWKREKYGYIKKKNGRRGAQEDITPLILKKPGIPGMDRNHAVRESLLVVKKIPSGSLGHYSHSFVM